MRAVNLSPLLAICLLCSLGLAACAGSQQDCIDTWSQCQEGCDLENPSAQKELAQCMARCQPSDPDYNTCVVNCAAQLQRECARCDEELKQCLRGR
jgi:hypothetical protein